VNWQLIRFFIVTRKKIDRYNIDTTFSAVKPLINYDTKRMRTATAFPDSARESSSNTDISSNFRQHLTGN
jgi:hypothetical protein